jgi:catechol 2,3-dioxygenase-like lactoylglutathione lyase family enzyme
MQRTEVPFVTDSSQPLEPTIVAGVHAIIYGRNADAARAFFRDVLGLTSADAGDRWLIFALPPAELAVHPIDADEGQVELYLMCHDLEAAVAELTRRGVEFTAPVSDQGWGRLTRIRIPGAGEMGLYEPRHVSPLAEFT